MRLIQTNFFIPSAVFCQTKKGCFFQLNLLSFILNKKSFSWDKHGWAMSVMVAIDARISPCVAGKEVRKGGVCRFQAPGTLMRKKEEVMPIQDRSCTVGAYFKVHPGNMEAFERLVERFVEKTSNESGIRYYGWSFDGEEVHCRQGYQDAEGFLEHVANVRHLFEEALTIAQCTRLAIHGPEDELAKLRGPMAEIELQYFILKNSFRR